MDPEPHQRDFAGLRIDYTLQPVVLVFVLENQKN